jgi:methanogenic corrinoid protein MtbC1
MTESTPAGAEVGVDPSEVIKQLRVISSQVTGQLMHDLAFSQALLAAARGEVERLTRVNQELLSANTDDGK